MIKVEIDASSDRHVARKFNEYRKDIKKTRRDITIEIGRSCAKQLAIKVQPFGLSAKTKGQFEGSIRKQVVRALRNAETSGAGGGASQAHSARRDSKGQVPKGLRMDGQKRRAPFAENEVEQLAKKKSENAGMVKGAWIAAGQSLGGKIAGVAKWVSRHATKNGSSKVSDNENTTSLTITNELSYAQKTITASNVRSALAAGYKNQWKSMERKLKKLKGTI